MTKRWALAMTLLAAAVLALLGGCGKGDDGRTTLVVWDWLSADPSKGVGQWLVAIDAEFERSAYAQTDFIRQHNVGKSWDEMRDDLRDAQKHIIG